MFFNDLSHTTKLELILYSENPHQKDTLFLITVTFSYYCASCKVKSFLSGNQNQLQTMSKPFLLCCTSMQQCTGFKGLLLSNYQLSQYFFFFFYYKPFEINPKLSFGAGCPICKNTFGLKSHLQLSREITRGCKYEGVLKNAEPETGCRKQRPNQGQSVSHLRPWNKMF